MCTRIRSRILIRIHMSEVRLRIRTKMSRIPNTAEKRLEVSASLLYRSEAGFDFRLLTTIRSDQALIRNFKVTVGLQNSVVDPDPDQQQIER